MDYKEMIDFIINNIDTSRFDFIKINFINSLQRRDTMIFRGLQVLFVQDGFDLIFKYDYFRN